MKKMFGDFRLIKNLALMKSRLEEDRLRQANEGYHINTWGSGPETYITYSENGREIGVIADFTWFNDVLLYTDSLRKWTKPYGEELTQFDYQRVLNRATRYLSCWGMVTLDETKLPDNEDLKRSLTEQGIEFTELDGGVIHYTVDASVIREQQRRER
jgi:hypothetical protein